MNASTTSTSKAANKATVQELRNTVLTMDSVSQDGLSEISAIARLALAMLEQPDGYRHPELIAMALRSIYAKSDLTMDCINATAEFVGCNHIDESLRRRHAARTQAQQQDAGQNGGAA
jgi:hypothetical protein